MRAMRTCSSAVGTLSSQSACWDRAQSKADQKDWIQLFNGKTSKDWTHKFAHARSRRELNDTFRVEDGLLKVRYDKWQTFNDEFGHIFYREPFSLLRDRRRIPFRRRSGEARHGPNLALGDPQQRPDAPRARSEDDAEGSGLPDLDRGAAARRLDDGKPRTTANLCTPGTNVVMDDKLVTRHCINSTSKTYDGDQWVRVEVLVHGDELDAPHRRWRDGAGIHEAADRRRQRRARSTRRSRSTERR